MLLSIYFRTYLVKVSIIIKSRCSCCKAHATFNVVAASQGANARARTHLQHFFCVFFIMSTFGYQTFIAAKGAGRVLRPHSAEFECNAVKLVQTTANNQDLCIILKNFVVYRQKPSV